MTGIVLVSHSLALAQAARDLAVQMTPDAAPIIHLAAGMSDGTLGTDATAVMSALEAADAQGGAVVLMDLGSAILSAEMALELVDPELASRAVLCAAPFVEGLVAAAVTAASGADPATVAREARGALGMKVNQLGEVEGGEGPDVEGSASAVSPSDAGDYDPEAVVISVVVTDPHGLHARPAATLVRAITELPATIELRDVTSGSDWVPGDSIIAVMGLGVESGHEVAVRASGADAAKRSASAQAVKESIESLPA